MGVRVLAGGETRSASVSNALEAVETDLVAIHDAARPLVTAALIGEVAATLAGDPGAAGAIAATPVDTVKRASDGVVDETLSRDSSGRHQTPPSSGRGSARGADG